MKKGFTLAEVLITLGIIGIVAALTIPNLIAKFQEKALESQFKKTYSLLNEALKLTNYDNSVDYKCYTTAYNMEGVDYYKLDDCRLFYNAFFNHLKVISHKTVTKTPYKTKAEVLNEGGSVSNNSCSFGYLGDPIKYTLVDGSTVYINNPNASRIEHQHLFMTVDINGDNGPNKWGYDVFYLTPTKRKNGSLRINEAICVMWEKGGKRASNILNNLDEVKNDWYID